MTKEELYTENLIQNIKENITKYFKKYIDNNELYTFCELKTILIQNVNCLLLNNYIASICLTNHLLEKFIKLSIINYGTNEVDYSNDEQYNNALKDAYSFDSKQLGKTLLQLKEIQLISDTEFEKLREFKDDFRNPYSHSDTRNIIKGAPENFKGRIFSLEDGIKAIQNKNFFEFPSEEKIISSLSPAIAQIYIEDHAKIHAHNYFDEVFNLILKVDKRIQKLKNKNR